MAIFNTKLINLKKERLEDLQKKYINNSNYLIKE